MRGQTGGVISMGTGIIHGKASKHKMNSRISNETEIIGDSEYLPYGIWVEYFMDKQGRRLKRHVLWQDNEGAEKMCENGKRSCSSKSRHISIKYFWVSDRVRQEKIDVRQCPTTKMLADFFTKPLEGGLFHQYRRIIMRWDHIDVLAIEGMESANTPLSSSKEERVENIKNDQDMKSFVREQKSSYADVVKMVLVRK